MSAFQVKFKRGEIEKSEGLSYNYYGREKMEIKKVIKREIDKIPEEYCKEILNFIKLLEQQEKRSNETAILSESSLRKDWLNSKEDEVWKDL